MSKLAAWISLVVGMLVAVGVLALIDAEFDAMEQVVRVAHAALWAGIGLIVAPSR